MTQSVATATPTPRSPGSYCYELAATGNQFGFREYTLAATKTDVWVRFGVYVHWSGSHEIVQFNDAAGATQGCVRGPRPTSSCVCARGHALIATLGTSTFQMTADAWHTIEVRWRITSTTVGTVELWVDGTRWLNLTSIDNTNTANTSIQRVALGVSTGTTTSGDYLAWDDLAINDTNGTINNGQIGDGRVVLPQTDRRAAAIQVRLAAGLTAGPTGRRLMNCRRP